MVRSRSSFIAIAALIFLAASVSFAKGGAEVTLSAAKTAFSDGESVAVNVTITNTGRRAVRLLKWYTPIDGLEEPIFRITLDGRDVAFVGPHYKRPEPTERDFYILKGGESVTRTVDLSMFYDMSLTGTYEIAYDAEELARAHNEGQFADLDGKASNAIALFVEGRPAAVPEPSYPEAVSGSTTFTKCTTTQQSGAGQARTNAATYAANALSYLTAGTQGPRYTTWFGAYNSSRYSTVRSHFSSISNAMNTASVNINCGCNKNYYAYVYPTQPYTIYVCRVFWQAPATGTDSKAGTLIHEMSHFNIVASTDDWVYGQSGARSLAISDPAKAIDNADSHEYFAENTPSQN
jgi:peptidyl-Lys metalloendopeptidase